MKSYMYILCLAMGFILAGLSTEAMAQSQEPVDIELLAEEEANRYQELLDLGGIYSRLHSTQFQG